MTGLPTAASLDDGKTRRPNFRHALFSLVLVFLGQSSLLLVFKLMTPRDGDSAEASLERAEPPKRKANPWYFSIAAVFDACGTFGTLTGLCILAASSYQMLKVLCLIFIMLLSRSMLGRQYSGAQYVAVVVITCGLALVAMVEFDRDADANQDVEQKDWKSVTLGVGLTVLGQLFYALQGLAQEYFLQHYLGGQ